jgi:hypothetical protein
MFQSEAQSTARGARALGWASIGIGVTEIVAPHFIQHALGLEDRASHRGVLRVLGVREIMHGVGLLSVPDGSQLTAAVWSRVAGDVLDSALLGMAATKTKRPQSFAAVAAAVAAIGLADLCCAIKSSRRTSTVLSS